MKFKYERKTCIYTICTIYIDSHSCTPSHHPPTHPQICTHTHAGMHILYLCFAGNELMKAYQENFNIFKSIFSVTNVFCNTEILSIVAVMFMLYSEQFLCNHAAPFLQCKNSYIIQLCSVKNVSCSFRMPQQF